MKGIVIMNELEWYVLNYDFNRKKVEYFNIFNNNYFTKCVEELVENFTTLEDFISLLEKKLMYCFWSKREYEIFVGDAFEENVDNYEKIDVYSQVKPNIKALAKYIINNS